ncbi:MAG: PIN domain-containing protein [Planctomycetota bacterium]
MRVFLDANVLFSGSSPGSITDQLLGRLEAVAGAEMVTSDLAAEEARRNLERKAPGWLDTFEARTPRITTVPSVVFPLPVELVEKDRPILCSAIRAECGMLATGDRRHFGHLYGQTVEGVTVVSLLGLAQWIKGQG